VIIRAIRQNKLSQEEFSDVCHHIHQFCYRHHIDTDFELELDFRQTRDNYKEEGLFGGFLDMWQDRTAKGLIPKSYINVNAFREYTNPFDAENVMHCIMHELGHIKQIQSRKMIIANNNTLVYNGRVYDRAPFKYDLFSKLFEIDPKLAQEYHTSVLPWEKDAYDWSEKYMGRPMYSYGEEE
jgi:hypothetical protein